MPLTATSFTFIVIEFRKGRKNLCGPKISLMVLSIYTHSVIYLLYNRSKKLIDNEEIFIFHLPFLGTKNWGWKWLRVCENRFVLILYQFRTINGNVFRCFRNFVRLLSGLKGQRTIILTFTDINNLGRPRISLILSVWNSLLHDSFMEIT